MIYRTALAAVLLTLTATGCTDRYRNPCEAAAPTTTIVRTKNKALGWVPPSTIFYQSPGESPLFPRIIEKCA
jgi:urease accessory protein UreH